MSKNKGGRPSGLTPAVLLRVMALAARGLNQTQICKIVKVRPGTMIDWKRTNPKLTEAIEKGQAIGIARRLARIEKAAKAGSWQADAWYLERVHWQQFGRRDRAEISGPGGGPVESKHEFTVNLTAAEVAAIGGGPKQLGNGATVDVDAESVPAKGKENGK